MMRIKVIGCGAAGNKAAISLIEKGFESKSVTLINSTSKDIAEKYKDISIIFGATTETMGGCGKERTVGRNLILKDLKEKTIDLESCVNPETDNLCVIVSSTEGGSGSAVTPILAKYISEVIGVPTIVCLFFGFNTDVRGMQNSIEICQELSNTYGVIGISNASYLEAANGNKIRAEQMANDEFCAIARTLTGYDIHPGSQNIDDTDLFKLVATPGYMFVGNTSLSGVKNIAMFDKIVNKALDETHLLDDGSKSCKRIGCIFNIPDNMMDAVDFNGKVFCQRFGEPYEMFTHIQPNFNSPSISWIIAGMDLPIEQVKEIFENYKQASSAVNKKKDSFFEEVNRFSGDPNDQQFDSLTSGRRRVVSAAAKDNFFNSFNDMSKK